MDADPWLDIKEHSCHGRCELLLSTHGDNKKSEIRDQSGGQLKESPGGGRAESLEHCKLGGPFVPVS